MNTCKACVYWQQREQNGNRGICRRYAPRAQVFQRVSILEADDTTWPLTKEKDWCGEWRSQRDFDEGHDKDNQ